MLHHVASSSTAHHDPQSPELEEDRSTGTLAARIIPRGFLDYANTKPFNRRAANESYWKQLVDRQITNQEELINNKLFKADSNRNHHCTRGINDSDADRVVVLDIDIPQASLMEQGERIPVHVELHMQRQADESANRTLRRMELSTQRKILHGYHWGNRRGVPDRESSIASTDDSTSCIMIKDPSAECSYSEGEDDENSVESDGYRQFDISSGITIGQLLAKLRGFSGTMLYLDGLLNDSPGIALKFKSLPPTVLSVETFEDFTVDVFVGVPLVVETKVLHAERALIVWFVDNEQVAFDCCSYTPTMNDIGKQVSVFIAPLCSLEPMGEYAEVYQFENLVQKRPRLPIVARRESWIPRINNDGSTLRIMSYNLLADEYASREIDQRAMYNHCKREDIARTRRMPLLVYEMVAHRPDILCLQEVDEAIFQRLLYPVLQTHGYHGYYSTKASAQLEGCAMFWNLDVFHREAVQEQFPIRDLVETDSDFGSMGDIKRLLDQKPCLKQVVTEKVGQVFQVATLRLKDPNGKAESLVVGNTHLFYHPMADHIRAIQTYLICEQIDRTRRAAASPGSASSSPFIICGDLNSDPLSGAVRLLVNREVKPYHYETWKHLDQYSWEQGEEEFLLEHGFIGNNVGDEPIYQTESFRDASQEVLEKQEEPLQLSVDPPLIALPPSFPELEPGYESVPEFTNYAVDFAETLDYIFASKASDTERVGFELVSSASVPRKEEMKAYVAMPNENMPSDHVSIASDFKWVTKG